MLYYLLLVIFLALVKGDQVIVDPSATTNTNGCGGTTTPCKTIVFAFQNYNGSNPLTIVLLNGTHALTSTITISKNFTVQFVGSPQATIHCSGIATGFQLTNNLVNFTSITFDSCPTAVIVQSNSSIFYNVIFSNCSSGIFATGASNVTIDVCSFSNFQNSSSPIYINSSHSIQISRTSILNNNHAGGAVRIYNSTQINFIECSFSGNTGEYGAIYIGSPNSTINFDTCTFSANVATKYFSGVICANGSPNLNLTIQNSKFLNNVAALAYNGTGGAIFVDQNITLSLVSSSFSNNTGFNGGAINVYLYSTLNVDSCTFTTNNATNAGGAIYGRNYNILISNSSFVDNTAVVTGGFYGWGVNATVKSTNFTNNNVQQHGAGAQIEVNSFATFVNCKFTGNNASIDGAAIMVVSNSNAKVSNCTFERNTAGVYGGAIFANDLSVLEVDSSSFVNNSASVGGAISVFTEGTLNINSVMFINNSAAYGGAIYIVNYTVVDTNSTYLSNQAISGGSGEGAAMRIESNSVVMINNSRFQSCISGSGALSVSLSALSLGNCKFISNYAYANGAAIELQNSSLSDTGSNYSGNKAAVLGGSVYALYSNTLTFLNSTFSSGSAINGSAVYSDLGTLVEFISSNFFNNSAQIGGALFSSSQTTILGASTFTNNSATLYGGGIYVEKSNQVTLYSSIFTGNSAKIGGGGLYINTSTTLNVVLQNLTVVNNTANSGGGIFVNSSGTTTIVNSAFINNTASNSSGIYVINTTMTNSTIIGTTIKFAKFVMSNTLMASVSTAQYCCSANPSNFYDDMHSCNYPSCPGDCETTNNCFCFYTPSPATVFDCGSCVSGAAGVPPTCSDIDYCDYGLDNCSDHAVCSNSSTPFSCSCSSGYDGTGYNCTNINECLTTVCPNNSKCIDFDGGYNCSCNSGYAGNGSVCSDINECKTTQYSCSANATCVNTIGGYTCSCNTGFSGNGSYCQVEVPVVNCNVNNGGCDYHTTCSVNGTRVCSSCPTGFTGTGDTSCQAQCGNKKCEADLGENCVSCPVDCPSPCGLCGDGVCNATIGEVCNACKDDCGLCSDGPTCLNSCSGHGTCQQGVCLCDNSYTGPDCSQTSNTNVSVQIAANEVGVVLSPASSYGVNFTLAITEIREVDVLGNIISSINLQGKNYSSIQVTNTSSLVNSLSSPIDCLSCNIFTYVSGIDSSLNNVYYSNYSLDNSANLEIAIWEFGETTNLEFANTTTKYTANSLKLAVQIQSWPFKSSLNKLNIIFSSQSDSLSANKCSSVQSSEDETANLKWFAININGLTLYGQLLDKAIVDGVIRTISFSLNSSTGSIKAEIPHFWFNSVVDPNYAVLVDTTSEKSTNDDCVASVKSGGKGGLSTDIILAIAIPVAAVVVAVVVLIVLSPKIKTCVQVRNTQRDIEFAKVHSINP